MPVVNYAHRGASEYFPENTLRSFYAGLEMRADGIETDIQRTSDGVLVLHHDDTLERVAGEKGALLTIPMHSCWKWTSAPSRESASKENGL